MTNIVFCIKIREIIRKDIPRLLPGEYYSFPEGNGFIIYLRWFLKEPPASAGGVPLEKGDPTNVH
jgi:hypothetical protein